MCVIVDMCVAHRLMNPGDLDYEPVRELFIDGRQAIVYGGQLGREYLRYEPMRRLLVDLTRRGLAFLVRDSEVDNETVIVESLGVCESNDAHVIALARLSGARVLCTDDEAAARDFKKKVLVDAPRGKVYRSRKHSRLLNRKCRGCRR